MELHLTIHDAIARIGKQAEFAELCKVSQPAVSKWLSGKSKPSAERALRIEEISKGKITRHDLRPDLFGEPPGQAA